MNLIIGTQSLVNNCPKTWRTNFCFTVLKFSRPVGIKKKVILNMKKTWVLLRVNRVGCFDSHAQT